MLERITPVILTFNEEANIERVLAPLDWARDIVVVDSYSTDGTTSLLARYDQVRLFQRAFDTHQSQWSFAIDATDIRTDWFLALDADYVLTAEFVAELAALTPAQHIGGYSASFCYCIGGVPLRGTLYPPVTVLCRFGKATYRQDGHTQRVVINGAVNTLTSRILHDDRKPLSRWVWSQQRYASLEADYLLAQGRTGRVMDRIRRWGWPAPIIVFLYTLVVKGCMFDGWRGWFYVLQRTFAEVLIAIEIIDRGLAKAGDTQRR